MKKALFTLIFLMLFQNSFAQVGMGTDHPQAMLDVRGDMTIREKIYLGGNDNVLGDHGKKGQVLVSQGPNKPPVWKTLNIPNYQTDGFYMIFSNAHKDDVGIEFNQLETTVGDPLYHLNDDRSDNKFNNWKDIAGLTKNFKVYNSDNKTFITYEAVVQLSDIGTGSVDYACGVFIDNKLQGVRLETVKQAADNHAFQTFLMVIIAEQLAEGDHQAKVACGRIRNTNYSLLLSIGKAIENNINNFIAESTLKIEVYETPETFIPIVD